MIGSHITSRSVGMHTTGRHESARGFTVSPRSFYVFSLKIFWLVDHPTHRAFPCCFASLSCNTVTYAAFVPTHSGGSAPDSHRVPSKKKASLPLFLTLQISSQKQKNVYHRGNLVSIPLPEKVQIKSASLQCETTQQPELSLGRSIRELREYRH